ncbi:hypothetical protein BD413DRAFT_623456 [Trametes elegans]|nr:hypothetical protein BD413DRAFT_623456 [Trametes elegans]
MHWLQIFRLFALSFTLLAGIIVLSIGAHLTATSLKWLDSYVNFEPMAIAVGGFSMVTMPVMIAIDLVRTGAFTSMVAVELGWLSLLWVLWLAAAALTVDEVGNAFDSCDFVQSPVLTQACNETHALEGFAFAAWLVLLAYTAALLVVALVSSSRGAPIWTSSVKEYASAPPRPTVSAPAFSPGQPAQVPMGAMPTRQPGPPRAAGYAPVPSAAGGQSAYGGSAASAYAPARAGAGAYPQM